MSGMKVFKFDVDEDFAKQHNEMVRDTRSLVASGIAIFVISLIVGVAVWFLVDPSSPWHWLGSFGAVLFGILMLVVALLIPRSVGKTQEIYDSNPLAPAIITERAGTTVTLTALVRGDVYNTSNTLATTTLSYRGTEGWTTRGIATAAIDVEWPFVGEAFGGTQVFKPRVQIVASPRIRNLAVPNEDARAIDLEDSNLFALNRFPGYDRVEDGSRVTWGVDWELQRPGWLIKTTVGQSYRLEAPRQDLFPVGTGLSERVTDFVGRTEVRFRNLVQFTHRFRLDKDNFAIRRNEIDATIGSRRTYLEVGYLRLNRDIATVEDLRDREELRAAARVAIGRKWSVFGSGVFNLTDREEDPVFLNDGFQPIRTRLGFAYSDDCIEFGATWRRDFIDAGDARRGNAFQVFFALRNLGFR